MPGLQRMLRSQQRRRQQRRPMQQQEVMMVVEGMVLVQADASSGGSLSPGRTLGLR